MSGRRPSQYASGIARKAAIMDAAFVAFGRIGYWNTALAQIAEDCGVTRAGLLHHFPTKEALLAAVLTRRDEISREVVFAGSVEPWHVPRDYLRRVVDLVEHNARQPGIVNLFAVLGAEATHVDHPAHEYFENRYRQVRGWMLQAFRLLQETGELREGVDPDRAAAELTALLDGLQIQWLYDSDAVDMPAIVRARIDELLVEPLPR